MNLSEKQKIESKVVEWRTQSQLQLRPQRSLISLIGCCISNDRIRKLQDVKLDSFLLFIFIWAKDDEKLPEQNKRVLQNKRFLSFVQEMNASVEKRDN